MDEKIMYMGSVTIEKDKLIAKIVENRTEHEKIYTEAVDGYKLILAHELKEKLEKLTNGELVDPHLSANKPTNHLKEYDCTISMLKYDVHSQVVLTKEEFNNYVLDDWSWKNAYMSGALANITGSAMYK